MQSLTQPTLLLKPFADEGDRNNIPNENTDTSNPQLADLTNGFPQITSRAPSAGELPPERKDINALGYLTTTYDYFYQAGGTFTYNATIASAIGGYPLGARLWYTDNNGATVILRSNKANNSDNFITTPSYIGTSWVQETPALSWDNTWSGSNTFSGSVSCSGSVSLGSSATATTPSASDNSTKVATTAWLNLANVKKMIIGWMMPDYSSAASVSFSSNKYTAPNHGYIRIKCNGSKDTFQGDLNGVSINVGGNFDSYYNKTDTMYMVSAGDVLTKSEIHGSPSIYFYKAKGA